MSEFSVENKLLNRKNICESPEIFTIDNFLSEEECNHMIELSKPKLKKSLVSSAKSGVESKGRTSSNTWINHNLTEMTKNIGEKIAKIVNIPLECAESFQVIHYDVNQLYNQHYDSFLFDNSDKSNRCLAMGGQRLVTALVYLNDVEEGGTTYFSRLKIDVEPKKGKLLIFSNVKEGTNIRHELSEHAGKPPIKGEKWAFNLWFRERKR